jgi:hypothetical protein
MSEPDPEWPSDAERVEASSEAVDEAWQAVRDASDPGST